MTVTAEPGDRPGLLLGPALDEAAGAARAALERWSVVHAVPHTALQYRCFLRRFEASRRAHPERLDFLEQVQRFLDTLPVSQVISARCALKRALRPDRVRLGGAGAASLSTERGAPPGRAAASREAREATGGRLVAPGSRASGVLLDAPALRSGGAPVGRPRPPPGHRLRASGEGPQGVLDAPRGPDAGGPLAVWFEAAGRPTGSVPVFPSPGSGHFHEGAGQPYKPGSLGRHVQLLLTRLGVWERGLELAHRFRRTFATEFLRANPGDLEGLRKLMRHDNLATTVLYVYLQPEDLASRMEQVAL